MICGNDGGSRLLRNIILYHSTRRHIQDDINFLWCSCRCFSFMSSGYLFHVSFSALLPWLHYFTDTLIGIRYTLSFVPKVSRTQFLQIPFKLLIWSSLYLRLTMRVYVVWSARLRHCCTWGVQVVRYPNFFFSGLEADRNVKVIGEDVAVL